MEVNIRPTMEVIVLGIDKREPDNIGFCAVTFGASRLFWIDGYLLCLEVYEKSIEYEIERGKFYISHLCYASFPKYSRILEVEKGAQIPIVNVSDMHLYKEIIKAILSYESKGY
ncbi:MAG: hypothetical protein QXT26_02740 [Thermoproteota archaeon]